MNGRRVDRRASILLALCPTVVALVVLVGLVFSAGEAKAAGIALDWSDCWLGPAASDTATFVCNVNDGSSILVAAFELDEAVNGVIGLEVVIDLQHADPILPDWWHLEPGGCRGTLTNVSTDFSGLIGCSNPWGTVGSGLLQSYLPGEPRGGANQARLLAVAFVSPSDSARDLQPSTAYYALTVTISHLKSANFPSCSGCKTDACLVLNSIELLTAPGGSGGLFLETPAAGADNQVTWQGTTASCAMVPVVQRSWGQIKGMYR